MLELRGAGSLPWLRIPSTTFLGDGEKMAQGNACREPRCGNRMLIAIGVGGLDHYEMRWGDIRGNEWRRKGGGG